MPRLSLLLTTLAFALLLAACSGEDTKDVASSPSVPAPSAVADEATGADETPPEEEAPPGEIEAGKAPQSDTLAPVGPRNDAEKSIALVRAWSTAINSGDNDAAAELFAPNALVIQGPTSIPLPDRATARSFNASLPCSGTIVGASVSGNVVTAVFELGDRQTSQCDAQPGTLAAADFLIQDDKILVWQLVPVPTDDPTAPRGTV